MNMEESETSEEETCEPQNEMDVESDNEKPYSNPGWADAISKILNTKKPKRKKTIVLSKAKRLSQTIKSEESNEEVDPKTGFKIVNANPSKDPDKLRKIDWVTKGRKKPSVLERDRERFLSKIAIKGVVQLFNAVEKHQKEMENQLQQTGLTENKKEKIIKSIDKRTFLNMLVNNSVQAKSESVKEEPKAKTWDVLKSDYMMGSKLKNWNKQDETEQISLV